MTPGRSQNRMSTYSTSSSEMYLSTSSELLNTLTLLRVDAGRRHAMGGVLPERHSSVSCRLTGITPQSRALPWRRGPLDRVVDARNCCVPGARRRYPGERFGVPETGPGSAAGFGRRLAALTVDWLLGYLIAGLFAGPDALGVAGVLVDGARRLVRAHGGGRRGLRHHAGHGRAGYPGRRRCGRRWSACPGRCCGRHCSPWSCPHWPVTATAGAGTTGQPSTIVVRTRG